MHSASGCQSIGAGLSSIDKPLSRSSPSCEVACCYSVVIFVLEKRRYSKCAPLFELQSNSHSIREVVPSSAFLQTSSGCARDGWRAATLTLLIRQRKAEAMNRQHDPRPAEDHVIPEQVMFLLAYQFLAINCKEDDAKRRDNTANFVPGVPGGGGGAVSVASWNLCSIQLSVIWHILVTPSRK